ncbi:hypothetical protein FOLKNPGA_00127 [Legionella sp. PC1000]|uniref:hypothetical protein n=1 Tax=Legionella sp. PC1000 TaxID=2746060 RepID=UPI0015FC7D4C|nr:hypothetical protein [Legionella sp. PC1000]QLZ67362.1 hypothetical protein FOLKNPGA_00127 [Legionella sp. PC1000]
MNKTLIENCSLGFAALYPGVLSSVNIGFRYAAPRLRSIHDYDPLNYGSVHADKKGT